MLVILVYKISMNKIFLSLISFSFLYYYIYKIFHLYLLFIAYYLYEYLQIFHIVLFWG